MPNDNRHDVHCDRAHCEMESGSILGTRIEMAKNKRKTQWGDTKKRRGPGTGFLRSARSGDKNGAGLESK